MAGARRGRGIEEIRCALDKLSVGAARMTGGGGGEEGGASPLALRANPLSQFPLLAPSSIASSDHLKACQAF